MIAGELGLTLDQALAFQKRHGDAYNIIYKPGLIYEHIDLNLNNPILADIKIRHALIYAIDRQAISDQLFDGKQPVANGQTNPLDRVYYDGIPKYHYDPKKAAALLEEAGWKPGPGGIRRNAKGEPLRLEIMTTAGNKTRELVEQALQSQWRQAGIDVRIRNEPARVFFGETVSKRKFSAMAMFAWISSPENIPRSTLHSDEIPTAENGWSGQNYTGFRNAEMDKVIDDLEVVCDPRANQALWDRMQTIYAEQLPAIPLYFRANAYILPKWLKGVTPTGHQYPTTLWVQNWKAE
jgi:peptide/nickel transport system substrate-binding protein